VREHHLMVHSLDDVIDGSLGTFWLQTDRSRISADAETWSGYLGRREDGRLELKVLLPRRPSDAPITPPDGPGIEFALGSTENGGVFLDGVRETGSSITYGGHKASTRRYEVDMVAVDVPIQALTSGVVTRLAVSWHGVGRWAGLTTIDEQREIDDDGRLAGITLALTRKEPLTSVMSDGTRLEIGSAWQVDGPDDSRLVDAPVTVSLSGEASLPARIDAAARIQDLVSIAYQGRVLPSRASIDLERTPDLTGRNRFAFWNRGLMSPDPGVRNAAAMSEVPLFYLADIGNLDGIRRWLDLWATHPVVLRPVVTSYRVGTVTADSMLLDVGSAIDIWRGANTRKRGRDWANDSFQPLAVGRSVGPDFAAWVGDLDKWSQHFWYHYIGLKHFRADYRHDDEAIHWLAISGQTLLTAVVLLEAAGGDLAIVGRIMNSHRWFGRRRAVRGWLASQDHRPGR